MGQGKEEQLLKKLESYAAGFYYDCTRCGFSDIVQSICLSTRESRDYNKFINVISNALLNKVYIEGGCWEPKLIVGLIDIILEILEIERINTGFEPANAMLGISKLDTQQIKTNIIQQFNKSIVFLGEEDLMPYRIKLDGRTWG